MVSVFKFRKPIFEFEYLFLKSSDLCQRLPKVAGYFLPSINIFGTSQGLKNDFVGNKKEF